MKLAYKMVICQKCGHEVPSGNYCAHCGKRFVSSNCVEKIDVDVCVNCGSLSPDQNYCSVCGYFKNKKHLF
ncbi:zinc ribbon domain-containing protein [Liquorilactobacillus sicerae]|uniref:zinc ribbon domain-containing protein n=1 Tax=Liquorilactobacillus sicerae TaxID=1416943 RepID=UPI002480DE46|nr:zinc ribbon domain-containing protein [Liquorilactobacillus sicerae]